MQILKLLTILAANLIIEPSLAYSTNNLQKLEVESKHLRSRRELASDKCDRFYSKTFVEHAGSDVVIYQTKDGQLNSGDITVWNNELYNSDDTKKVGNTYGFCVFLPELIYECSITVTLRDGKIQLGGNIEANGDVLAIVGGTGCHDEVEGGEVEINANYKGNPLRTQYKFSVIK